MATSSWRDEKTEKNMSKQASKVRHCTQRETLGKMAGGRQEPTLGQSGGTFKQHNTGRTPEPFSGPWVPSWIWVHLPRGLGGVWLMFCHSFEVTASCWCECLLRRTLHYGVTSVIVPYDQRNLTHWAVIYPSEDLRECSENSRHWPLLWRPWSQRSAQASSDGLSWFTEESLPPHSWTTGKYM